MSPDALLEQALAALAGAAADRASPVRFLQLATEAPGGLRTVVLRGFDRAQACATLHADRRSAKIREIAARPGVTLLAWDPGARLQIRMRGQARIHAADAVARAEWAALSPEARGAYALAAEPGAPVTDREAEARIPEAEAFAQFAVLRVAVAGVDVLALGAHGAQFRILATPGSGARRIAP